MAEMKTAAVIAEFNPFHSGHEYLLSSLRNSGATHIVAVMSGNFVQRGDLAIYDKFLRAGSAIRCGADLVVELPLPWAIGGAQPFARGGVGVAKALGCVDLLGFGSECGEVSALEKIAQAVYSDEFGKLIDAEMKSALTFAAARQRVCEKLLGAEMSKLLERPNNALAVEYLAALKGSGIVPVTVKRLGEHDSPECYGGFAGASLLREKIKHNENIDNFIPKSIAELCTADFADISRLETAVLCKMRCLSAEQIAAAPDISEGLENRIFAAAREAVSLEALFSAIKTKRYTLARLRRIVLSLFLGVEATDSKGTPPYVRVLAKNERGAELLAAASPKVPLVGRASQLLALEGRAARIFSLECRADDVYALAFSPARQCGADLKNKI